MQYEVSDRRQVLCDCISASLILIYFGTNLLQTDSSRIWNYSQDKESHLISIEPRETKKTMYNYNKLL